MKRNTQVLRVQTAKRVSVSIFRFCWLVRTTSCLPRWTNGVPDGCLDSREDLHSSQAVNQTITQKTNVRHQRVFRVDQTAVKEEREIGWGGEGHFGGQVETSKPGRWSERRYPTVENAAVGFNSLFVFPVNICTRATLYCTISTKCSRPKKLTVLKFALQGFA